MYWQDCNHMHILRMIRLRKNTWQFFIISISLSPQSHKHVLQHSVYLPLSTLQYHLTSYPVLHTTFTFSFNVKQHFFVIIILLEQLSYVPMYNNLCVGVTNRSPFDRCGDDWMTSRTSIIVTIKNVRRWWRCFPPSSSVSSSCVPKTLMMRVSIVTMLLCYNAYFFIAWKSLPTWFQGMEF